MSSTSKRSAPKMSINKMRRRRVYRAAPMRRGGSKVERHIGDDPEARILLSNVGTDVEDKQIQTKFSIFGIVKKVVIHCNLNKVRIGTAEVWMNSSKEAIRAKSKLNATDIFSDGRIIRMERFKIWSKVSDYWKKVFKYIDITQEISLTKTSSEN